MARPREIKRRIHSVTSTQQITRTMEMVSASKLKRAQGRLLEARPYHRALEEMAVELIGALGGDHANPLMRSYDRVERVIILLITSNRGLCGAFNNNLIRLCRNAIDTRREAGVESRLMISGKKGLSFFRHTGYPIEAEFTELSELPTVEGLEPLVRTPVDEFVSGGAQEVYIVSSRFLSAMTQEPVVERLLPIVDPGAEAETREERYLVEPSTVEIVDHLLPAYVRNVVYQAFLETHTSEHGARRTAMKAATENADEMIKTLTRIYNRERQAQITQELSEIVGGAEALRG